MAMVNRQCLIDPARFQDIAGTLTDGKHQASAGGQKVSRPAPERVDLDAIGHHHVDLLM